MAIADQELQKQERKNRRRIKAAVALHTLWPRRVHSVPVAQAFALGRADARKSGARVARRQLRKEMPNRNFGPWPTDHVRSMQAASSYARAADDAQAASLERSVVTETAIAFNDGIVEEGKLIAAEYDISLEKVWSAEMGAGTCQVCAGLDGTVVDLDEEFPDGNPGEVHPNCRCTVELRRKSS